MRWKPARAGIFNIWEYDDHTFDFGDGRLVLRGRNGSGKSNALSLLSPFLFDGVMSSMRMDPMGGSRSMRSLLLGRDDDDRAGTFRHESGTGYVWMELTNGEEHLTIGIGASATAQRDADAWFFVTDQRVGIDLHLAENDIPLSRRQLSERLPTGASFATAEEYRAAVDRHLFGLGPARYRSLIDLLLTLRRPHLAGKLDTDHLSATLSAGLGEIDPDLVSDVAHSFDDLDAMQHELEDLTTSLDAVERFLPIYREHLIAIARTRATAVEQARTDLRRVERDARAARSQLSDAETEHDAVRNRLDVVVLELDRLDATIENIQQSPAYQSAVALDEVRRAADGAEARAVDATKRATDSEQHATNAGAASEVALAHLRTRSEEVTTTVTEWLALATSAALNVTFAPQDFDDTQATSAVVQRRADVAAVRTLAQTAERAIGDAERAGREVRDRDQDVGAANEAHDDAAERAANVRANLRAQQASWRAMIGSLVERIRSLESVSSVADLDGWTLPAGITQPGDNERDLGDQDKGPTVDSDAGVHAATIVNDIDVEAFHIIDRSLGSLDTIIIRAIDSTQATIDEVRSDVEGLTAERDRVATEPNPGPPANPTRPDAHIEGRIGTPLFVCIDFAEHVDGDARAGFEAALGASGLLDARVLPTDEPGDAGDALDAALVGRTPPSTPIGPTLADVLVAVPTGGLDAIRIDEILRSIPLDGDLLELHEDGRWRIGPLAGRYHQDEQRYIGHAARERRRELRLAEVDELLVTAHDVLERRELRMNHLVEHRTTLVTHRGEQPSTAPLIRALDALQRSELVVAEREVAAANARHDLERLDEVASRAASAVQRAAISGGLPTTTDGLDEVDRMLDQCDRQHDRIVSRRDEEQRGRDVAATAAESATQLRRRADEDTAAAHDAGSEADAERRRYEAMRANIGGDAEQAVEQLAAARQARSEAKMEQTALGEELAAVRATIAALTERISGLAEQLERASNSASESTRRFAVVCSAEIAEVLALSHVEPGADLHDAAKAVLSNTTSTENDAFNRMEKAHREILLDGLRAGHDPAMPKVDDVDVIRVGTADGELPIGTLARQLREEHERTSQLLSKHEREIFETHLLTRIGDDLRRLLHEADSFEHRINDEMAKVPTESGMVVELSWEVTSSEVGLRDAVRTLRKAPELLGPDQRETLREFFMLRIADLRSSEPGRSFTETLTTALDYRVWHEFTIYVRIAGGKRQRVTRSFYKGLSGGEAATLIHLPLFAAAASQYSSGTIEGPRLIALDEAFAGIDDQMRARLMGLLTQLDLDVILTSHEFWGFYETVPSLVLYDLVRRPPNPGVFAQRFDWIAGEAPVPNGFSEPEP